MTKATTTATARTTKTRAITWHAVEHPPAKRWWWYFGFLFIVTWLTLIFLSLGDWLLVTLSLLIAITVLTVYRGQPRPVEARLTHDTVTINGQDFPLANYRYYRLSSDPDEPGVTLVPTRSLALRVYLPLSGGAGTDQKITRRLDQHLTRDTTSDGLLDWLGRWLRLG